MEEKITVKLKKLNPQGENAGKIPVYATPGAAGADLFASLSEDILLQPGERAAIPTGIAIELPGPEIVALVFARSGLAAKKGLALSNGVGVIDSDYRGEIKVLVTNLGQEEVIIQNGDRIAQILFINVQRALFAEVQELGDSLRGQGGFGSTGHK